MKIELKNIKFSEALSEETNAFVADVFVDNEKVAYAKNDGQGGNTYYHAYLGKNKVVKAAEGFCEDLPCDIHGYKMDLEAMIDTLLEDWLEGRHQAKFDRKLKKDILTSLCVKTPNGYSQYTWKTNKGKASIADMVGSVEGREMLQKAIAEAKAEGKEVLNTNIPQHLF